MGTEQEDKPPVLVTLSNGGAWGNAGKPKAIAPGAVKSTTDWNGLFAAGHFADTMMAHETIFMNTIARGSIIIAQPHTR